MSLRNMEVQYVGDTLYLPPLEREVKHIIVKDEDVKDWKHFKPVVRCRDCKYYYESDEYSPHGNYIRRCCKYFDAFYDEVEPNGFCAWGERGEA